MPVTILKTIDRDYTSEPLAFSVDDSCASGNFPDQLKLARIAPVFKKGSRLDMELTHFCSWQFWVNYLNCLTFRLIYVVFDFKTIEKHIMPEMVQSRHVGENDDTKRTKVTL